MLITVLLLDSEPVQISQAFTITVDTLVDKNDHNCSDDGDCSLRDAVETASFTDMIVFDIPGTINLGLTILISKNLLINRPGEGKLILDGGGSEQIFEIVSSVTNLTISGLTFSNGLGNDDGGAVHNSGTVTIRNSIFSDNDGEYGGAIKNDISATLTLNNCVFVNNHSTVNGGAVFNFGQLTLNDCYFSDNGSRYHGGAVHNNIGQVTINDSTLYNNITIMWINTRSGSINLSTFTLDLIF